MKCCKANSWGFCGNGTGALGCGPQEHFRTCSDIRITDKNFDLDYRSKTLVLYEHEEIQEADQPIPIN